MQWPVPQLPHMKKLWSHPQQMHSLATLPPRQSHLLTRARFFKMISASIDPANAPAWKMGRCKQQPERSSVHLPPPL